MYKGSNCSKIMTSNGIHKDWETLPPLKNPDDFIIKSEILVMKPTITRCCNHTLITEEEYKQMEDDIKGGKFDPTSMEFDEWVTAREAQEECDRRRQEERRTNVVYL